MTFPGTQKGSRGVFLICHGFLGAWGSVKFNIIKEETKKVKSDLRAQLKSPLLHPEVSVPSYVPGTVLGDPGNTGNSDMVLFKEHNRGENIWTQIPTEGLHGNCVLLSHDFLHTQILFSLVSTWTLQTASPAADPYALGMFANPKRVKSRKGSSFPKFEPLVWWLKSV